MEHNIRRIHRRSLSDHSARHRPPHFDKFESGSAFEGEEAPAVRSASSPRDQHKTRTSEERTPGRAPSSKVKDKTRARSPRPRSPPPLEVTGRDLPLDDMTSQQVGGGVLRMGGHCLYSRAKRAQTSQRSASLSHSIRHTYTHCRRG